MFSRPSLPLHLDIGCAKGRCIERLSKRPERKDWNHLGVEIRARTVEEAMSRVEANRHQNDVNCENLHFLTCNFAASAKELLGKFPRESLKLISIQFPDPWKRKKHKRRLLVQKKLVKQLSQLLPSGAVVYISTDCDDVAKWMVDRFLECDEDTATLSDSSGGDNVSDGSGGKCFRLLSSLADLESIETPNTFLKQMINSNQSARSLNENFQRKGFITGGDEVQYSWFESDVNPLGELSERELVCEVDWRDVRRCCFVRL